MFENNDDLQAYFQAVSVPQDIEGYEDREKIQELLSMVLEKMGMNGGGGLGSRCQDGPVSAFRR